MVLIKIGSKIIFGGILIITLLFFIDPIFSNVQSRSVSANTPQDNVVNADIEILVRYVIEEMDGTSGHLPLSDSSYVSVKNARLVLIDDITGEIIKSGLTDETGEWKTNIAVSRDPRFKQKNIGTITVIAVADGFNETIHFNVSVNEYSPYVSSDFIVLNPINLKGRNEPSFDTRHFHRFTVFEMLDDYAEMIGLERQPVVQEGEIPPWSPRLKNK